MNKKRSSLKVLPESEVEVKGRLVNSPSRSLEQPAQERSDSSPVSEAFAQQVYGSEQEALELLVKQVVSRYEEDPEEQAEMREFLNTVLETDPALRSEILAGALIRR